MMKRLTSRKPDGLVVFNDEKSGKYISDMNYGEVRRCMDRLATFEELINEGKLIETPRCAECKYEENNIHQFPCSHCLHSYDSKFEHK